MIRQGLVLQPKLVVVDEPVSALDVSMQSQVLNPLVDLKHDFNLSYLFVAHNLARGRYISDRIAVMYSARSSSWQPPTRSSRSPSTRLSCLGFGSCQP